MRSRINQEPNMNGQSRGKCGIAAVVFALGMSIATHAAAQLFDPASPEVGRFYAFGGLALFSPQSNDQLQGERTAGGLLVGGGFRLSPLLSFELGALGTGYRLDTPASVSAQIPGGTNLKSSIGTEGLNLSVKFHFTQGRIDPYFGAGVGLYTTNFRTTSEDPTCQHHCADTGPRVRAHSNDAGYHALVGLDYHLRPKDVLVAEFRYLSVKADFDDINLGKVNAGGSLLWMGYRRYF
jgi:opacity protein-like surface antigen